LTTRVSRYGALAVLPRDGLSRASYIAEGK
jgi:hypothetical protein